MKKNVILILIICFLQSCYFGVGLIEEKLPENFMLVANNSLEELEIIRYKDDSKSIIDTIINKTVFAIGFNKDFIIAKSYSNGKVLYHIIQVEKKANQNYLNLTFEQFNFNRENLNIPYNLNFTIVFHEVAKN